MHLAAERGLSQPSISIRAVVLTSSGNGGVYCYCYLSRGDKTNDEIAGLNKWVAIIHRTE